MSGPERDGRPWWEGAVLYQIYPRSFLDTSGNGVGDLGGVRARLDYLVSLGVDGVWLSPIYPSPMADHGYDVADYCDVDPLFGTLEELDLLVAEAHERGLRVLLDWVPCHTSDQHPWFVEARSSRDSPKRDWYMFRDGSPDQPPNRWRSTFPLGGAAPGSAWTWDEVSGAWYYHRFTPEQPDLNLANPDARAAAYDTVRFWLDRGIDGFRIDVVQHLGKDPSLITDDGASPQLAGEPSGPTDPIRTHEYVREVRALFDGYADGDGERRLALGEVYILDLEEAASYVGSGPGGEELHLGFNFLPLFLPWKATEWREHLAAVEQAYGARSAWPTWAFGSHDIPRQRTRLGSEARARAMAVMLLGLRGTPFLYAGEELGLSDPEVPPEMAQDPAGFRDGCRAPIPWDGTAGHGWAGEEPWLPWPPEAASGHAEAQQGDRSSTWALYQRLLAVRRDSPALSIGSQEMPATVGQGRAETGQGTAESGTVGTGTAGHDDVVAWIRRPPVSAAPGPEAAVRVVAVNFGDRPAAFDPTAMTHAVTSGVAAGPVANAADAGWAVEVASDRAGEGQPFSGTLAPSQAVILRPRNAR
jgi:alpha-glucosidase